MRILPSPARGRRRRRSGPALAALALVLALPAVALPDGAPPKVLVLGFDGMDPQSLQQYVDEA